MNIYTNARFLKNFYKVFVSSQFSSKTSFTSDYNKILSDFNKRQQDMFDAIAKRYESKNNVDTITLSNEALNALNETKTKNVAYSDSSEVFSAVDLLKQQNHDAIKNAGNTIEFDNGYKDLSSLTKSVDINYTNSEFSFNHNVLNPSEISFNRDMINAQIENILASKNISLDDDYKISINPSDYKIKVQSFDGNENETTKKIENALNQGNNGKNLYNHIYFSYKDYKNEQIVSSLQQKRHLNDFVKEKTGIDLKTAKNTGSDFVSSDGKSVKELLHADVYADSGIEQAYKQDFIKLMDSYLEKALSYDYNDGKEQVLSISLTKNGLADLGQDKSFATTERGWIEETRLELEEKFQKKMLTFY